jgi:hypothetical protein
MQSSQKNNKQARDPFVTPRPDRLRSIKQFPFAWLDARLLKDGWLVILSAEHLAVYIFLCLAANRHGVSWYRSERIASLLGIDLLTVKRCLRRLQELELIAYKPFSPTASDGFLQVLSLPSGGPPSGPQSLLKLWNPPSL